MKTIEDLLTQFSVKHQLPEYYPAMAQQWFVPLAEELNQQSHKPLFVGINGCQGSGKSTVSDLLKYLMAEIHQKTVVVLSIDDFYLTLEERQTLANDVHPLFITRGVPGTHDTQLLQRTLQALLTFTDPVTIPRFNKAIDDRHPPEQWECINSKPDIVILEGWCVGAQAQDESQLKSATNILEHEEDKSGTWRNYSNQQLIEYYADIFEKLHYLIQLKAPSFDCVYQWRKKQEKKLRQKCSSENNTIMDEQQLIRFIHHYQRITEHCFNTVPEFADNVFYLNETHQITHRDNN